MIGNYPFLLRPAGKDYLWGGSRLRTEFGKKIELEPLAETWECSVHPAGFSYIASGEYKGKKLIEILEEHPEYLGTHPDEGQFPILVKFIDASQNLSIQVHPTDEYARKHENGQLGKTEMWYVVDAAKDASLIYGLKQSMSKEQVRSAIEDGSIENYLNRVPVNKGNVFIVEAGTIHGIGAGTLVAEIQESSDLTYRLYDYNRVDKNGNKRELHIDKALDVANLNAVSSPRQPMRVLKYKNGSASELLGRCKYFQVERVLLNTERNRNMYPYQTGSNSFNVLLCTSGCGVIVGGMDSIYFFKGDCIFVPANSSELKIHGMAEFLKIEC